MTDHKAARPGGANLQDKLKEALALFQQGDFDKARDICASLLDAAPRSFDAMHLLGLIALQTRDYSRAADLIGAALKIHPKHAWAHNNHGHALMALGQMAEAVKSYDRALALKPDLAEAWSQRGVALQGLQKHHEALQSYDRALALSPDVAQTWNNRAVALDYLGRFDEALQSYDHALVCDPRHASAWSNRGTVLIELGRRAAAIESFEEAISLNPQHADAHWNLSLCALQMGDFERGWSHHAWRWKAKGVDLTPRTFTQPEWQGKEDLRGKTILIHADQGFGDTLQFARYVPEVARLGARVLLEVRSPLVSLLAGYEGVAHLIARGEALPAFDVHCPLGSMPAVFEADSNNIPAADGYLSSSAAHRGKWDAILGPRARARIGVAWSGSRHHKNDHNRSIALAKLAAALPDGIEYISLQKDMSAADEAFLNSSTNIRSFGVQLADFSDTAALCDLVDVVISVDTSIAHLAGALGRPTWVLLPFNPDWRWLLERTDSPWYATARLYRQDRSGGWSDVLERIKADLLKLSPT